MNRLEFRKDLKKEGESILYKLRNNLYSYKDVFRTDISDLFFERIKEMKEDLSIAESVAIHEQLEREGKLNGSTYLWYENYKDYIKDKAKHKKTILVEKPPTGFLKPDLKSIVRIFELVSIDIEFDEDLYFDVKNFLTRYEILKDLS